MAPVRPRRAGSASCPEPSTYRCCYRSCYRLLHAAAPEVVLVEALEVPDLVQQRVADLLAELRACLHGAAEVLAIEDDRRRLVAGLGRELRGLADGTAVEPEDRRREWRLDRAEVRGIREVGDLDADRLDARATLGGQRIDDRVDFGAKLRDGDQNRGIELGRRELRGTRERGLGGGHVPELLEGQAEHLVRVRVLGLDRERALEGGAGVR